MIKDEMSTDYFHTMDEAYQVFLKVEEKVDRKNQQKLRGRGWRGRGKTNTIKENEKEEESISNQSTRWNGVGRGKGFERGKGKFVITCYRCGVEGHKASKCPEKKGPSKRCDAIMQVTMGGHAMVVGEDVVVLPH